MNDDTFNDHESDHEPEPAIKANVPAPAAATADIQLIDPFDLYLQREQAGDVFFDGDFIYFNGQTGAWTRNKKPIPATVPVLCNMNGIVLGWIKVIDGKTVDRSQLGFLINGYQPLDREQLDDLDERNWPYYHGKREDVWKETTYLPMRTAEGENVVFGPFAVTQRKAITHFIGIYRRSPERAEGKAPLVLLESRSFPNQGGGTTHVPVFRIVGWQYWDGAPAPEVPPVAVPVTPPAAAKPAKPASAKPKSRNDDMDDDIPF